jgi:hypothetical protein
VPLENFRRKRLNTASIQVQKDMIYNNTSSEEPRNAIANGPLTKPMAVARWLVKYSGAGARSGKYRSDIPRPTRKPCVSKSCHIDRLKEASVNPAATMSSTYVGFCGAIADSMAWLRPKFHAPYVISQDLRVCRLPRSAHSTASLQRRAVLLVVRPVMPEKAQEHLGWTRGNTLETRQSIDCTLR